MFRDDVQILDESDRAVTAILIAENTLGWCERAVSTLRDPRAERVQWRVVRDAYDVFPELWRYLDRARSSLARRGANTAQYDELRPSVATRLATADDDGTHSDDRALDDARRAVSHLKLSVPGVDWDGIERRTRAFVDGPFFVQRRRRTLAGGAIGAFAAAALVCLAVFVPKYQHAREEPMDRQLASVAEHRRARIVDLQREMISSCTPMSALELTKLLVMDNRRPDAQVFANRYQKRCGDNYSVQQWAHGPRPDRQSSREAGTPLSAAPR